MEPTGVDVERLEMGAQQNPGKVEPRAGRVHLVSHPHNSAKLPCFRQVPSVKCVGRVHDVPVACTCGIYFPSRSILVAYSQNTPCNISAGDREAIGRSDEVRFPAFANAFPALNEHAIHLVFAVTVDTLV